MKKKKEINKWKIATLVLGIIFLFLISIDLTKKQAREDNFVSTEDLCSFYKIQKQTGQQIRICDIERGYCLEDTFFLDNPCE